MAGKHTSAQGRNAAAKAPISQHPAFPFIVGLWFAALLGLGSLVLPIGLVERVVTMTGISDVVPGAQPPLGFTARALIALASAVAGAGLGAWLARKVSDSHANRQPARRSRGTVAANALTPRPIFAHEELGDEGLDAPLAPQAAPRRRGLALENEAAPSEFFAFAPLPGGPGHVPDAYAPAYDAPSPDAPSCDAPHPAAPSLDAPFDNASVAAPFEPAPGPAFTRAQVAEPAWEQATDEPLELSELAEVPEPSQPAAPARSFLPDDYEPFPLGAPTPPVVIDDAAFDDTASEEAGFEEARCEEARCEEAGEEADLDAPVFKPADEWMPDMTEPTEPQTSAAAPAAPQASAEPALMQLTQRLGHAIERRREQQRIAAPAAPAVPATPPALPAAPNIFAAYEPAAPEAAPVHDEAARPEEAAQAMAAYFNKPAAIHVPREQHAAPTIAIPEDFEPVARSANDAEAPAAEAQVPGALRSFLDSYDGSAPDEAEEDAEEPVPHFGLPAAFADPLAVDDDEAEDEAEEEAGNGFSSLLRLNNPFVPREQSFVRVEEPEADHLEPAARVVFPGAQEPAAPVAGAEAAARPFDRPGAEPVPARGPDPAMDDALRNALAKLQRMSGAG